MSLAGARAYLDKVWGADVTALFDRYARIPHKVDLWRYCLLYDRGGIYMDADCVLLAPIDDLVEDSDCFFVSNDRGDRNIFNGFLGTLPRNPTYKQVIDFMVEDAARSQRKYYFGCDQLYEILNSRVDLLPGVESYRDGSTRISVLWDTRGDDDRYYASYRGVVRLVETNHLYPYRDRVRARWEFGRPRPRRSEHGEPRTGCTTSQPVNVRSGKAKVSPAARLKYLATALYGRGLVYAGLLSRRELIYRNTYRRRLWGSVDAGPFFSGPGSLPEHLTPYLEYVGELIRTAEIRSVVDLGCGDFRASRALDLGDATYLGIDIVSPLIRLNQTNYGSERIRFERRDLLTDDLPEADLCIIKHVMQHWSNSDILSFLPKLDRYRHVLILNGRFDGDRDPPECNADIETGAGFRHGGLHLDRPPFHCDVETVLSFPLHPQSVEELQLVRLRARHGTSIGAASGPSG